MSIKTKICETPDEVAAKATAEIVELIGNKPNAVIGLATGQTPVRTYAELIRLNQSGLSFAHLTTFNLDEYWGLDGSHNQSYRHFMNHLFFFRVDIPLWNTHMLNGVSADPDLECQAFEAKIKASGGVDMWLLGIGHNGHIAFNEPGSPSDSRTRLVDLDAGTIEANSRFFRNPEDVPKQALTAGIATIFESQRILLLATGLAKSPAVTRAVKDAPHPICPASFLQNHPDCTFIIDKEAASGL